MHNLNEWKDREGKLIGASVFLTAEEVRKFRENGQVKIEIQQ